MEAPEVRSWLQYAHDDLKVARRAQDPPPLVAGVYFHAQQAAEKARKGYLLAWGLSVPRTHLLRQLAAALREAQAPLPPAESIRFLDTYGVGVRYPDQDLPPEAEAQAALAHAEAIVVFVEQQLIPMDEAKDDSGTD